MHGDCVAVPTPQNRAPIKDAFEGFSVSAETREAAVFADLTKVRRASTTTTEGREIFQAGLQAGLTAARNLAFTTAKTVAHVVPVLIDGLISHTGDSFQSRSFVAACKSSLITLGRNFPEEVLPILAEAFKQADSPVKDVLAQVGLANPKDAMPVLEQLGLAGLINDIKNAAIAQSNRASLEEASFNQLTSVLLNPEILSSEFCDAANELAERICSNGQKGTLPKKLQDILCSKVAHAQLREQRAATSLLEEGNGSFSADKVVPALLDSARKFGVRDNPQISNALLKYAQNEPAICLKLLVDRMNGNQQQVT